MKNHHLTSACLALLLIACRPGFAQNAGGDANWDNVRALGPGTEVLVEPNRHGHVKGKVEAVTEESLVVQSGRGQETFARGEIVRVSVRESRRKKHTARGAKWGAGVGVVIGLLAGRYCSEFGGTNGTCYAGVVAAETGFGAGLGALIGAAAPAGGWRQIYHEEAIHALHY